MILKIKEFPLAGGSDLLFNVGQGICFFTLFLIIRDCANADP
jgi:hypothetical protein